MSKYYLAIDPGTTSLGWALLRVGRYKKIYLEKSGILQAKGDIGKRLKIMYDGIDAIFSSVTIPSCIFVEDYFVHNRKGSKAIPYIHGIIYLAVENHYNPDIPIKIVNPGSAKKAATGSGVASKSEVKESITELYPKLKNKKIQDEFDAIAIGLAGIRNEEKTI